MASSVSVTMDPTLPQAASAAFVQNPGAASYVLSSMLDDSLHRSGMVGNAYAQTLERFRSEFHDGNIEQQSASLMDVTTSIMGQTLDTIRRVTPEQYQRKNTASWPGTLFPQAGPEYRDVDKFRMMTIRFGEASSRTTPILGIPETIGTHIERRESGTTRLGRAFECPADNLMTSKGTQFVLQGLSMILKGAIVRKEQIICETLAQQRYYQDLRVKRCTSGTAYQKMCVDRNDMFGILNKNTDAMITIQRKMAEEMQQATATVDKIIIEEHTLDRVKNSVENWQPRYTGRPKSLKGLTNNDTIQGVEGAVGDGGMFLPLSNSHPEPPLRRLLDIGCIFPMGPSPIEEPPPMLTPRRWDILVFSPEHRTFDLVKYSTALNKMPGVWEQNGHLASYPSFTTWRKDDIHTNPFFKLDTDTRKSSSSAAPSYVPIDVIGEMHLKDPRLLLRHPTDIVRLTAANLGWTFEAVEGAIAAWVNEVELSDTMPFDTLLKGTFDDTPLTGRVGGISSADVTFTPFLAGWDRLRRFSEIHGDQTKETAKLPPSMSRGSVDYIRHIAGKFFTVLNAMYNAISEIHDCALFDVDLLPPEVSTTGMPSLAVWYTYYINHLLGDHHQVHKAVPNTSSGVNPATVTSIKRKFSAAFGTTMPTSVQLSNATDIERVQLNIEIANMLRSSSKTAESLKTFTEAVSANAVPAWITQHTADMPDIATMYNSAAEAMTMAATKLKGEYGSITTPTDIFIPERRMRAFLEWQISPRDGPVKFVLQTTRHGSSGMTFFSDAVAEAAPKAFNINSSVSFASTHPVHASSSSSGSGNSRVLDNAEASAAYYKARQKICDTVQLSKTFQENLAMVSNMRSSPAVALAALAVLFSKFTRDCNLKSYERGIAPLMRILVWQRPRLVTTGIIGVVSGKDTAMVNETQNNMHMGISMTKLLQASYTFKFAMLVIEPANVNPMMAAEVNAVDSGGAAGDDEFGLTLEDTGAGKEKRSLLALPMSLDDDPRAPVMSVIGIYPQIFACVDPKASGSALISTGPWINQLLRIFRPGSVGATSPVASPGSYMSMGSDGRFSIHHQDMGVFGKFATPELFNNFLNGVGRVKRYD